MNLIVYSNFSSPVLTRICKYFLPTRPVLVLAGFLPTFCLPQKYTQIHVLKLPPGEFMTGQIPQNVLKSLIEELAINAKSIKSQNIEEDFNN